MGFFNDEIDISNLKKNQQYDLAGNGWAGAYLAVSQDTNFLGFFKPVAYQ